VDHGRRGSGDRDRRHPDRDRTPGDAAALP
jgi:hypothetical protein